MNIYQRLKRVWRKYIPYKMPRLRCGAVIHDGTRWAWGNDVNVGRVMRSDDCNRARVYGVLNPRSRVGDGLIMAAEDDGRPVLAIPKTILEVLLSLLAIIKQRR